MGFIIFIIALICCGMALYFFTKSSSTENPVQKRSAKDLSDSEMKSLLHFDRNIPVIKNKIMLSFRIKGVNNYADDSDIDHPFICSLMCDYDNKYDKYAIAAYYDEKVKKIGYIPKGQKELYNTMASKRGMNIGFGFLYTFVGEKGDDVYTGEVIIPLNYSEEEIDEEIKVFMGFKDYWDFKHYLDGNTYSE